MGTVPPFSELIAATATSAVHLEMRDAYTLRSRLDAPSTCAHDDEWATIVNIVPERLIMKLTFLGKDSTPNDSPTLYATDRDTYLVQGYVVIDPETPQPRLNGGGRGAR